MRLIALLLTLALLAPTLACQGKKKRGLLSPMVRPTTLLGDPLTPQEDEGGDVGPEIGQEAGEESSTQTPISRTYGPWKCIPHD